MNRETEYGKLVRDRIPEIISASGKTAVTRILNDDEYRDMLDRKLHEELAEYLEAHSFEELCNLTEVIMASAAHLGYSLEDLLSGCAKKRAERGGFDKKILLKKVIASQSET